MLPLGELAYTGLQSLEFLLLTMGKTKVICKASLKVLELITMSIVRRFLYFYKSGKNLFILVKDVTTSDLLPNFDLNFKVRDGYSERKIRVKRILTT